MMAIHLVKVPDVGEGVAEVELVAWSVAPGEEVNRNQVLAEVMTDKANVEIPSPVNGTVAAIHGAVGATLAVGTPLIELEVAGSVSAPGGAPPGSVAPGAGEESGPRSGASLSGPSPVARSVPGASSPTASPPAGARPAADGRAGEPGRVAATRPPGKRPRATPAVRHRARQAGVELRLVPASGPAGRVTHEDLDAYLTGPVAFVERGEADESEPPEAEPDAGSVVAGRQPDTSVGEEPIIGVRRRIAENTLRSTRSIPHITYVDEVDVTALEDLRAVLNEDRPVDTPHLTLLPFLVRALVRVLPDHPSMNAHVDDDAGVIRRFGGVHVGIATQTETGLMVPVVRHAEVETLWSLAGRITALADAARNGAAARHELSGSTITVSSLGSLGGLVSTPVINKPEVAILGVNKIVTRPRWIEGQFVPRRMMNLSSSFDHRVVDGWDAATFVQALRRLLEQPALLVMEQS
jgi:2-oxoisovalerate dehydrogenase E2 component (dihydrolipoyl transacylase)